MKNILLASASAFAFAGAAAADVTFSGEAELGYNDEIEGGFYWEADLGITFSQELNNGLTAGASFTVNVADNNLGNNFPDATNGEEFEVDGDYLLWLESESAALYFGATDPAAIKHWVGVDGMEAANFTEDATDQGRDTAVLRGDISYGGVDASLSYLIDPDTDPGSLEQLSVGAAATFGNFNVSLAYQDDSAIFIGSVDDFYNERVFGVSVGTTFGGADVSLAYAKNDTLDITSTAIGGSYPIGPVTVGAYFSNNTGAGAVDGNTWGLTADYASGPIGVSVWYEDYENFDADWGIDATYDVGNGLTVLAGADDAGDSHYFGAEFDMGSGATLGLSYSNADEIGAPEYKEGTTAWVSFTF